MNGMYKIGILERDEAYLNRLVEFLKEHHRDSFDIHVINKTDTEWDNFNMRALDIETVQYDALFIGDTIKIEGEFPEKIVCGYITEKEESSACCINKYQSLEKIYKHMFAMCEEDKRQRELAEEKKNKVRKLMGGYDLNPETVERDGETYRVYHIEESKVDMLAIKMLTANHILGLGQVWYNSGELGLRITNMKTLYEIVQQDNTLEGKQKLLKIMGNMVSTALSLEEYMLSADRLVMYPKEIYLDEVEGEVIIPYIPIKSNNGKDVQEYLEELRDVCDFLLEGLNIGNNKKEEKEKRAETQTQEEDASLEILQIGEMDSQKEEDASQKADLSQYISADDLEAASTLSDGEILESYGSVEKNNKDEGIHEDKIKENRSTEDKTYKEEQKAENMFAEQQVSEQERDNENDASTEAFENLQNNAKESLKLKNGTMMLGTNRLPFIIRERTGEKILIDRNIFKLGKDDTYVDYCIKDNPTVSRNHADIVRKADGFYLVDKGSLNHTFVDGKKLGANEYKKLNNGCLLQLADEVFEFVMNA